MSQRVVFWGSTGQSRVLSEAISYGDYELISIVDNREIKNIHGNITLLKGFEDFLYWLSKQSRVSEIGFAVAIGGGLGRERVALQRKMQSCGLSPLTIIHPTAFVSENAMIGEGSQILANSTVCVNVKVGLGSIINTASSVDHDCVLGEGVHIGPGAHLAGEISVGNGAFVGTGAIILPGLRIGDDAIIGAGAVVVRDVVDGAKMIGNPARLI